MGSRCLEQPVPVLEVSRRGVLPLVGIAQADESRAIFSVIAGAAITPALIYIPGLNTVVFRHTWISWEWAPAVIGFLIFALGIELWKWCKRAYYRRRHASHPEEEEGMTGAFAAWKTAGPTDSNEKVV